MEDKSTEYIQINRDIYFEEGAQLKRLKSGAIGKLLTSEDLEQLFGTMTKETIKEFFEEMDLHANSSIVSIGNCIYFLNWEDYSYLRLASKPFILPEPEVCNASA